MERFSLTCRECGIFLTEISIDSSFMGRDVSFSMPGSCQHVTARRLTDELYEVLHGRSSLPVRVSRPDADTR